MRSLLHVVVALVIAGGVEGQDMGEAVGPLLQLLTNPGLMKMTQLATDIAVQSINSNRNANLKAGGDQKAIDFNSMTPSQMFGQSMTNFVEQTKKNMANPKMNGLAAFTLPPPVQPNKKIHKPKRVLKKANTSQKKAKLEENSSISPEGRAAQIALLRKIEKDGISVPDSIKKDVGYDLNEGKAKKAHKEVEVRPLDLERLMGRGGGGQFSDSNSNQSPLIKLAEAFMGKRGGGGNGQARGVSTQTFGSGDERGPIPNIRDVAPAAKNNFGIPRGEGCLPLIGEFMQMAYGNCVKYADERTFDAWGNEIKNGMMGGSINLMKASIETCKMQAERDLCGQIKRAISECDILGTIQVGAQIQRSFDRCDQITGLIDRNPMQVLNQIGGLVNGEVAQGFINNFLG
uniref:Saposin B-type domain-containing protein n=1 Tax=Rhabditophanes sp. KR3021 TaxID=114890 RepID=A0AC35U211_9BILA